MILLLFFTIRMSITISMISHWFSSFKTEFQFRHYLHFLRNALYFIHCGCLPMVEQSFFFQAAKKVSFRACHSGKLWLARTSPRVISTSPKTFFDEQGWLQFSSNLNFPKNFTQPSGKLKKGFTSPIAKSTSPGLSDNTFFARCFSPLW